MVNRKLGVGDTPLLGGQHVCAFSTGPAEQDKLLFGVVRAGLWSGDYCVVAVDDFTANRLSSALAYDLRASPGRLRVETFDQSSLNLSASNPASALDAWESILDDASSDLHPFVRLGGEASWWLDRGAGLPDVIAYETELHAWIGAHAAAAMVCSYDMSRFPPDTVDDLVALHNEVIIDGRLYRQPIDLRELSARFTRR
ncbi:MAG: MEDS domain-containing protein [Ilumatobacteraceae bacterium]